MSNLLQILERLPENLASHLNITVIALLAGVGISLPLAILLVKRQGVRYPVMTIVSIIQTIPSLALLALFVPVMVGVSALTAWAFGIKLDTLGFWPTIIALTLYSMLPIVRNTVTGIAGVPAAMVEAARGVGMTERQVLFRVELPLASPVIIAGIRTATVWVVGIATLATPVGQKCLGDFIFRGLQIQNWTMVLVGCVSAAVLAILLDLLIGGIERGVRDRNRPLATLASSTLGIVAIVGLIAPAAVQMLGIGQRTARVAPGGDQSYSGTVWVGSKTFTEQFILVELMSDRLEEAGFTVRTREGLGSAVIFNALAAGEIDVYVDYTGTIWANYMNRAESADAASVLSEVTYWVAREHGIWCLGSLGFENAYGLAMRRDRAEELGIRTIGDLAAHAAEMEIGGDYEFFGRPEWEAIRDAYGLNFANERSFDSTFMYTAVQQGEVDVISAFTSDGRIAAYDLVILDDPRNAIPPYDAVVLLSRNATELPGVQDTLRPLIGRIDVDRMRRANYRVDRDEDTQTVDEAATWLREQIE